jgi:hypothetical protein
MKPRSKPLDGTRPGTANGRNNFSEEQGQPLKTTGEQQGQPGIQSAAAEKNPTPNVGEPSTDSAAIAQRAHEIWIEEGRPEGRHLDHWTRAEQEVRSRRKRGKK